MSAWVLASVALLLAPRTLPAESGLVNRLAEHPSPYLAMHGDDPVAWQEWGPEAVSWARKTSKPLFVSIGYFTCYWCHVMHRESYGDPEIAAVLNDGFIPVKVDREVDPALDSALVEFSEATLGRAGWPLNVIMTPEGYPLAAVLYLPPERFQRALLRVRKLWEAQPEKMARLARAAYAEIREHLEPPPPAPPAKPAKLRQDLTAAALELADEPAGGFGDQAKFPLSPQLRALLALYRDARDPDLGELLRSTLNQMATGGLWDHIEGGFFRYTVDPAWRTPHFEKMLYDNAQLAEVYWVAAGVFADPRYRQVTRATLDFVLDRLAAPGGGYLAALSAVDAEGVEGGYYLFSETTLQASLEPAELAAVRWAWDMAPPPELEGGHHPARVRTNQEVGRILGISAERVEQLIERSRTKLLKLRHQRTVPKDVKVIAAWNGMLLRTLARLADREPRYRQAGDDLVDFIRHRLWTEGGLIRGVSGDRSLGPPVLNDYAEVASGLAAWAAMSGDEAVAELAWQVATTAWQRFHTAEGWRRAESMAVPLGGVQPAMADGATTSPTALLASTMLRLARARGERAWTERAREALSAGASHAQGQPFWFASHIAAYLAAREPGPAPESDT
jgi:uncharacterized protein YyaL (SSP411 family)